MPRTEQEKRRPSDVVEVPVEIDNIDGINPLALILRHGMNELWGPNASRKSRTRAAIDETIGTTRSYTVGISDARRDGTDTLVGTATVAGRTLTITRSGAVSRTGQMFANLSLADTGAVSRLIDPGIKDDEAKRREQIKALLELVPLGVTAERIAAVAGDDEPTIEHVVGLVESKGLADMLGATKAMRTWVQASAREQEEDAERQAALLDRLDGRLVERVEEAKGAAVVLVEPPSVGEPTPEGWEVHDGSFALTKTGVLRLFGKAGDAQGREEEKRRASEELGTVRAERRSYLEAVAGREELRGTLDSKPDPTVAIARADALAVRVADLNVKLQNEEEELERLRRAVEEKQRDVAGLRSSCEEAQTSADDAFARRGELVSAAERWEATSARLDEPLQEVGEEVVTEAEAMARRAEAWLALARIGERYFELQQEAKSLQQARSRAEKRAEKLRGIERGAWGALGELVTAQTDVPEITISNGFVAYRGADGVPVDWNSKYVSTGQRNSAAFRLGARCFGEHSIIQLDGGIWETLEIEEQLHLHRVCREERIFGLTEVASTNLDRLRHVLVGTAEWADSYRLLAEAAVKAAESEAA
jgi:hypothetical protein